jgi:hypothetical protein
VQSGVLTCTQPKVLTFKSLGSSYACNTSVNWIVDTRITLGSQQYTLKSNQTLRLTVNPGQQVTVTSVPTKPAGASCNNLDNITASTNTNKVRTLKNGDNVPTVGGLNGQTSVEQYVSGYISNGKMSLGPKDIIYLFEIGQTNPAVAGFDLQDNVVLATVSDTTTASASGATITTTCAATSAGTSLCTTTANGSGSTTQPIYQAKGIQFPGLWLRQGPGSIGQYFKAQGLLEDTSTANLYADMNGSKTNPVPTTDMRIVDFLPTKPTSGLINLGTVTNDTTLPRTSDTSTNETINGVPTKVYRYKVNSITLGGNKNLTVKTINAAGATTSKRAQKVIFYLDNNIDPSGSSKILHTCTNPGSSTNVTDTSGCDLTNFVIYGYNTNTSYAKICTHGSHQVQGFIIAPYYTVGGNASGSNKGGFHGAVWANKWSSSSSECGNNSSNQLMVQQKGNWSDVANWNFSTNNSTAILTNPQLVTSLVPTGN